MSVSTRSRFTFDHLLLGLRGVNSSSQMPRDGVIFSDGVEADYLSSDSGAVASISGAEEKARLVAG